MSKKYRKKTTRSRRKQSQFRGTVLGVNEASMQLSLPVADVIAGIHIAHLFSPVQHRFGINSR